MVKMLLLCRGCNEVWKTSNFRIQIKKGSLQQLEVLVSLFPEVVDVPSLECSRPGWAGLEQCGLVEDLSALAGVKWDEL